MATFDAVLSDLADYFLFSLDHVDREAFYQVLDILCQDPYPDDVSKAELPFPYTPGTLSYSQNGFWIVYRILNAATIAVVQVYWAPDSPRRPMNAV